jgi:hypothetical protein
MKHYDVIVIGGGAAGFFGAIKIAEEHPDTRILVCEKGKRPLEKVRISGGGRCNVTHACFEPRPLTKHYPRGERELLGPFHSFMTGDMMGWLSERGVETKIEDDGRVFPVTDSSETIINCFQAEIHRLGVELRTECGVRSLLRRENGGWEMATTHGEFSCEAVFFATGSSKQSWKLLADLGCELVHPVPSLFTFNCKDEVIRDKMGLSVPLAEVQIPELKLKSDGPLLITHWGLSGPAILRLSAWGARELNDVQYKFTLHINWTADARDVVEEWLREQREDNAKMKVANTPYPDIPRRLWESMVRASALQGNWADQSNKHLEKLASLLTDHRIQVNGKSTFKDEFVTAGGVDLKEVNFKTLEHKTLKGLYLAGEVLNIDAITGGFNFQSAWTTAWLAGQAIAEQLETQLS